MIVGESGDASTGAFAATLWTPGLGLVDLNAYLASRGVDLTGWYLGTATGISADGSVIVGQGSHNGELRSWYVHLPAPCYANCDASTTAPALNVADFACFLNRFASGDTRANCDLSALSPVLNIADFACFVNAFAVGCS
jgi:hypothetical protein